MEYLFKERQKFTQWWLLFILLAMNGIILFILINKLMLGPSNIGLWFGAITIVLLDVAFYFFTLETRINKQEIQVRFFPFHFSFIIIPWNEIEKIEVRKYNPLMEFGGWGLRDGSAGKAYNVSGNIGIQLFLKDGSRLLIGTTKKEAVEMVLKQLDLLK